MSESYCWLGKWIQSFFMRLEFIIVKSSLLLLKKNYCRQKNIWFWLEVFHIKGCIKKIIYFCRFKGSGDLQIRNWFNSRSATNKSKLCIYLFICSSIYVSICLSFLLFMYLTIHLSYLCINSIYLPESLFIIFCSSNFSFWPLFFRRIFL